MGLYDIIHYKCPYCDNWMNVQTKLFSNSMTKIETGDVVSGPIGDATNFVVKMKEHCSACQKEALMVVLENEVKNFIKNDSKIEDIFPILSTFYYIMEKPFGEFEYQIVLVGSDKYTSKW